MRIAVTGTHSVGKSTFVKDFLELYPHYIHEEEPYRALRKFYDIKFGKASSRYCNGLQMYYNISRVKQYPDSSCNVICDRSPIDYIAYSQYTANYRETDIDQNFVESMIEPVKESLTFIDLLIFVPITKKHIVEFEEDGIRLPDREYRTEVDHIFKEIYYSERYAVMSLPQRPKVIEIWGDRQTRLEQVKKFIK